MKKRILVAVLAMVAMAAQVVMGADTHGLLYSGTGVSWDDELGGYVLENARLDYLGFAYSEGNPKAYTVYVKGDNNKITQTNNLMSSMSFGDDASGVKVALIGLDETAKLETSGGKASIDFQGAQKCEFNIENVELIAKSNSYAVFGQQANSGNALGIGHNVRLTLEGEKGMLYNVQYVKRSDKEESPDIDITKVTTVEYLKFLDGVDAAFVRDASTNWETKLLIDGEDKGGKVSLKTNVGAHINYRGGEVTGLYAGEEVDFGEETTGTVEVGYRSVTFKNFANQYWVTFQFRAPKMEVRFEGRNEIAGYIMLRSKGLRLIGEDSSELIVKGYSMFLEENVIFESGKISCLPLNSPNQYFRTSAGCKIKFVRGSLYIEEANRDESDKFTESNCDFDDSYFVYGYDEGVLENGNRWVYVRPTDYPIYVDLYGKQYFIDETNKDDVLEDGGSVRFEPESMLLTLTDAEISGINSNCGADLTINLVGESTIEAQGNAIEMNGNNLVITGDGKALVVADDYCIAGAEEITIRNTTVELEAGYCVLMEQSPQYMTVERSKVTMTSQFVDGVVTYLDRFWLEDSRIVDPLGTTFDLYKHQFIYSYNPLPAGTPLVIEPVCETTYYLPEFFELPMEGKGSIKVVQRPDCEGIAVIEAVPNEGYEFFMWGDRVLENPRTLDLKNEEYNGLMFADFVLKGDYIDLTFRVEPAEGATLTLTDARGMDCSDGRFVNSTQNEAMVAVTLAEGYEFDRWEYDTSKSANVMEQPENGLQIHFSTMPETMTGEDGMIETVEVPAYPELYVLHVKKPSTGIEEVLQSAVDVRKVMIDGALYILKDGKMYDVLGAEVR